MGEQRSSASDKLHLAATLSLQGIKLKQAATQTTARRIGMLPNLFRDKLGKSRFTESHRKHRSRRRGRSRSSESHEVTSAKSMTNKRPCFMQFLSLPSTRGWRRSHGAVDPTQTYDAWLQEPPNLKRRNQSAGEFLTRLRCPHMATAGIAHLQPSRFPPAVSIIISWRKYFQIWSVYKFQLKKKNTKQNNNCTIPWAKCYY